MIRLQELKDGRLQYLYCDPETDKDILGPFVCSKELWLVGVMGGLPSKLTDDTPVHLVCFSTTFANAARIGESLWQTQNMQSADSTIFMIDMRDELQAAEMLINALPGSVTLGHWLPGPRKSRAKYLYTNLREGKPPHYRWVHWNKEDD